MKQGLSLDQKRIQLAKLFIDILFINNAEFVGIAIFSPGS